MYSGPFLVRFVRSAAILEKRLMNLFKNWRSRMKLWTSETDFSLVHSFTTINFDWSIEKTCPETLRHSNSMELVINVYLFCQHIATAD